ncbi:MAG: 4-hydroxy-tetrahydrodipicolinate reductase [Thermotogae bacterium]|nr:4-hydroxy-tetrahydrodipicolinate reductase [Thermotogota bacterium]HOO75400.1 dihydrodipicolinate reductase C-terminal domain-containing protein [Tepiditoga sp.]
MKYGIIGFNGRMGKEIESLFSENGHEFVFGYDRGEVFEKDIPEFIIDFSLPEVLEKTISFSDKFRCPVIIGTTGYSSDDEIKIKELSKRTVVIKASNFSKGINLMKKITEFLDKSLNVNEVEILETHHIYKKDKPSGTALFLADALKNNKFNIESLRIGNIPGDHSIFFGTDGEVIEIKHRAISRRAFAEGVLLSADKIKNMKNGFYSFSDIMFEGDENNGFL